MGVPGAILRSGSLYVGQAIIRRNPIQSLIKLGNASLAALCRCLKVIADGRTRMRTLTTTVPKSKRKVGQATIPASARQPLPVQKDAAALRASITHITMETQALVTGESSAPAGSHNPVRGFLEIATSDPIMASTVR